MIHAHGHTQAADSTVLPGDGGENLVEPEALKDHLGLGSGLKSWTLPRSVFQCDRLVVLILRGLDNTRHGSANEEGGDPSDDSAACYGMRGTTKR